MIWGFKVATAVLVVVVLVWLMLILNTFDKYAHFHYLIDEIEGTYLR